jgi:adenylyltransferase/sulfurtransferase
MSLSDTQRARYARHLLLPELGEAGQLRLCAGRVRHGADRDPGALGVARDYLARAGVGESAAVDATDAAEVWLDVGDPAQLAGRPELLEAARALCGAFAAVEAIKALAGLGTSATLGPEQRLSSEEA